MVTAALPGGPAAGSAVPARPKRPGPGSRPARREAARPCPGCHGYSHFATLSHNRRLTSEMPGAAALRQGCVPARPNAFAGSRPRRARGGPPGHPSGSHAGSSDPGRAEIDPSGTVRAAWGVAGTRPHLCPAQRPGHPTVDQPSEKPEPPADPAADASRTRSPARTRMSRLFPLRDPLSPLPWIGMRESGTK